MCIAARQTRGPRCAFTLVELIVVMAVIAMLMGILIPVLGRAQAQAKLTQCRSNLHQLGMAMSIYLQDNSGYTPPLYGWTLGETVPGWDAHWPNLLFHQTDDHYSQGILTQRTAAGSPEKAGKTGDWLSGPQHFIATGLGILYRGGYMNRNSGTILTCPSYQFNLHIKGEELMRIATKYQFDKSEGFWTIPELIRSANGDNVQDIYGYDPGNPITEPWHVGVLTTSYWMRQNANFAMVNRPCWNSWNTRESRYSNIALVSDMVGVRAGHNSYYHVADPSGDLRDVFPLYDCPTYAPVPPGNYSDAEAERRFSGFYMQNHDREYNVLFSDGSVKTFRDGGHALTKSIGYPANDSSSAVAATFFEAFDGIYSAE